MDRKIDRKKEFLLEKRRYGLKEEISKREHELLKTNMPIQKIIGFVDLDDLVIKVNRNVLIPRYETLEVVLFALKYITKDTKVLDLCAGSGIIGLTIKQKKDADVTLADIDEEAILQIKENAELHNMDVKIVQSDLFENINEKYDVIISNPPYIPEKNKLDKSVLDYEPHQALFAAENGNYFYKRILLEAEKYLKKNGILIFEISEDNLNFILENRFNVLRDINNKYRIAFKNI